MNLKSQRARVRSDGPMLRFRANRAEEEESKEPKNAGPLNLDDGDKVSMLCDRLNKMKDVLQVGKVI